MAFSPIVGASRVVSEKVLSGTKKRTPSVRAGNARTGTSTVVKQVSARERTLPIQGNEQTIQTRQDPRMVGIPQVINGNLIQSKKNKAEKRRKMQEEFREKNARAQAEEDALRTQQMAHGINTVSQGGEKGGVLSSALKTYKRIKAGSVSITILWSAIWFWIPQFFFWIGGLAGLAGESLWLASWLIPGEAIFGGMNFLVSIIGIITMVYGFMMYSLRSVDAFGGMKGLVFCFCVAFYCAPLLNFFPWFVVWLLVVTYSQGKD